MGQIKLTPEDPRTSATKYKSGSEEIDTLLSNLTSEQNNISQNWDGDAFRSFDEQFNELSPKIREFSELLTQINEQMNRVAEIVEQTDQEIASQIRRVTKSMLFVTFYFNETHCYLKFTELNEENLKLYEVLYG